MRTWQLSACVHWPWHVLHTRQQEFDREFSRYVSYSVQQTNIKATWTGMNHASDNTNLTITVQAGAHHTTHNRSLIMNYIDLDQYLSYTGQQMIQRWVFMRRLLHPTYGSESWFYAWMNFMRRLLHSTYGSESWFYAEASFMRRLLHPSRGGESWFYTEMSVMRRLLHPTYGSESWLYAEMSFMRRLLHPSRGGESWFYTEMSGL